MYDSLTIAGDVKSENKQNKDRYSKSALTKLEETRKLSNSRSSLNSLKAKVGQIGKKKLKRHLR